MQSELKLRIHTQEHCNKELNNENGELWVLLGKYKEKIKESTGGVDKLNEVKWNGKKKG